MEHWKLHTQKNVNNAHYIYFIQEKSKWTKLNPYCVYWYKQEVNEWMTWIAPINSWGESWRQCTSDWRCGCHSKDSAWNHHRLCRWSASLLDFNAQMSPLQTSNTENKIHEFDQIVKPTNPVGSSTMLPGFEIEWRPSSGGEIRINYEIITGNNARNKINICLPSSESLVSLSLTLSRSLRLWPGKSSFLTNTLFQVFRERSI